MKKKKLHNKLWKLNKLFKSTPAEKELMLEKYDLHKIINISLIVISLLCISLSLAFTDWTHRDILTSIAIGILIYFATCFLPKIIDYYIFRKHNQNTIVSFVRAINELTQINLKSFNIIDDASYEDIANGVMNNYLLLFEPLYYEIKHTTGGSAGPYEKINLNEYNGYKCKEILNLSYKIKMHSGKYSSFRHFASIINSIENCEYITSYQDISNVDDYYLRFYSLCVISNYIKKYYPKYCCNNVTVFSKDTYCKILKEQSINRNKQIQEGKEWLDSNPEYKPKYIPLDLTIQ